LAYDNVHNWKLAYANGEKLEAKNELQFLNDLQLVAQILKLFSGFTFLALLGRVGFGWAIGMRVG